MMMLRCCCRRQGVQFRLGWTLGCDGDGVSYERKIGRRGRHSQPHEEPRVPDEHDDRYAHLNSPSPRWCNDYVLFRFILLPCGLVRYLDAIVASFWESIVLLFLLQSCFRGWEGNVAFGERGRRGGGIYPVFYSFLFYFIVFVFCFVFTVQKIWEILMQSIKIEDWRLCCSLYCMASRRGYSNNRFGVTV